MPLTNSWAEQKHQRTLKSGVQALCQIKNKMRANGQDLSTEHLYGECHIFYDRENWLLSILKSCISISQWNKQTYAVPKTHNTQRDGQERKEKKKNRRSQLNQIYLFCSNETERTRPWGIHKTVARPRHIFAYGVADLVDRWIFVGWFRCFFFFLFIFFVLFLCVCVWLKLCRDFWCAAERQKSHTHIFCARYM